MNWNRARLPSLHHRKEGWPCDQENIAKPPRSRGRGGFPIGNKRKPAPVASVSVAARRFLDDATTPPCGDARRGIVLDSNLFTASQNAAIVLWLRFQKRKYFRQHLIRTVLL